MKIGDKKTVTLAPVDAYGEYSEENTQEFPLSDLTAQGITPVAGETVPSMM
jgi:FKBP-type peptidyl-prolyl cis-trans isomerase 2